MFCRTLLLIILTSVVYSEKLTTRDQDGSKIISLEMPNATDISTANIKCFRLSDGQVFFNMQTGERRPSAIEYEGRVQYRSNPREGTVDIELSNFTKDDEGKYKCQFFKSSEIFNLELPLTTSTPGLAAAAGTTQQPVGQRSYWIIVLVLVVLVLVLGLVLAGLVYSTTKKLCWRNGHVKDQAQPEVIELQNLNGQVSQTETGNGRSLTEEREMTCLTP